MLRLLLRGTLSIQGRKQKNIWRGGGFQGSFIEFGSIFHASKDIVTEKTMGHFDRCDLLIPWSRTSLSQNWAFAVVGPALWNDCPPVLRSVMLQRISSASLRSLKTFIFTSLSR